MIQILAKKLEEEGIKFDPNNQWVRCLAHIINLSVQDALKRFEVTLEKEDNEDDDISGSIAKVYIYKKKFIMIKVKLIFIFNI
jgi:hypothetical protein